MRGIHTPTKRHSRESGNPY